MITVDSLSLRFGHNIAVVDNNFTVKPGETVALVGESGSGKSVTALAIMGLLPATAIVEDKSRILLGEQDLLSIPEVMMRKVRGGKIAMVFQEASTALNPVLTIGEQISEVLHRHLGLKGAQHEKIDSLLAEVGIKEPSNCRKSYPHQLSGGMKQRAMIAMALAGEPEFLIADEPTTALDVTIQAQVLALIKKVQQQRNMGMLFITHDLGVVHQLADEVVVMKQGEIVEKNYASDFFAHPDHPYSQALFAALPKRSEHKSVQVTATKPLLAVQNLKVHFPIRKGVFKRTVGHVKAVDGVSFDLYQGQTLALVGESGSGKTTTGMGILQLIQPTAGHVEFAGLELNEMSSRALKKQRRDLQIIFQDPYSSMNPRMLVHDIIAEGMLAQGLYQNIAKRRQRVGELLSQVGLDPAYQDRYPHEFSGGQRQRICIARALAVEPKFIVCDEPTSALDVSVQQRILELLAALQQELHITYLLITHDFGVVKRLADSVAVMYHGKIVEAGSVDEILTKPCHPYTQKLLQAVPTLPQQNKVSNER